MNTGQNHCAFHFRIYPRMTQVDQLPLLTLVLLLLLLHLAQATNCQDDNCNGDLGSSDKTMDFPYSVLISMEIYHCSFYLTQFPLAGLIITGDNSNVTSMEIFPPGSGCSIPSFPFRAPPERPGFHPPSCHTRHLWEGNPLLSSCHSIHRKTIRLPFCHQQWPRACGVRWNEHPILHILAPWSRRMGTLCNFEVILDFF